MNIFKMPVEDKLSEKKHGDMVHKLKFTQFHIRFIFTPIATLNIMLYNDDKSYYAYTAVYIFGIRVAIIQRNEPWKKGV